MKLSAFFKVWSMIIGILVTSLLLLVFAPKIIGKTIDEGFSWMFADARSFSDLWDDPLLFVLIYFTGYALVWWKPLWGSLLIMAVSIFYIPASGSLGSMIFAVPTLLVGASYLIYYLSSKRNK